MEGKLGDRGHSRGFPCVKALIGRKVTPLKPRVVGVTRGNAFVPKAHCRLLSVVCGESARSGMGTVSLCHLFSFLPSRLAWRLPSCSVSSSLASLAHGGDCPCLPRLPALSSVRFGVLGHGQCDTVFLLFSKRLSFFFAAYLDTIGEKASHQLLRPLKVTFLSTRKPLHFSSCPH